MHPSKTQTYNRDGLGRDSYIATTNGGFYPDRKTNGIEEIGKSFSLSNPVVTAGTFVTVKQQPRCSLANIHAKPVVYTNNGGGRDTYISANSGGLRTIH